MSELNVDVEALLNGEVVEFVIDVLCVFNVALQAEDHEALEGLRLVHHRVEVVGVVEDARLLAVCDLLGGARLLVLELVASGGLRGKVGRLIDLWAVEYLRLDGVGGHRDFKTPLLHVLRLGDHVVQLADAADTIVWLLEETLAHLGHRLLVLAHLLRNADKHAQFRGQIDILSFLFDLEERLVETHDLLVVLLAEVLHH